MKLLRKFDLLAMPLLAAAAALFFFAEGRQPLRKRVQGRLRHIKQNAGVAAIAMPVLRLALLPALVQAAKLARKSNTGLVRLLRLPRPLQHVLAFLLLDYGNYLWHVLNHRSGLLWRFHNVHHIDLDLDVTTAWRFHAGEVLASVVFRGGMVWLIGAAPGTVLVYEMAYEGCNGFHHSNWNLPYRLERLLCKLVVTPRMHGIHHSIVREETGSNFSVVFSFWDRLHRTLTLNVPQEEITIGVPGWRNPLEQTPGYLLRLPFIKQRPWQLPGGTEPMREKRAIARDMLAP